MKNLTIVRHAKSSWSHSELSDRERPLNKRGKRDAPVMGQRIAEAGIRPALIISSPAVRAWETAKVVAQSLSYPLKFLQREDELYHASMNKILDVLAAQHNRVDNVMLFGHNPGLTAFANFLSAGLTANLPTSGVVSARIDQDHWNLHDHPQTEIVLHDWPKKAL